MVTILQGFQAYRQPTLVLLAIVVGLPNTPPTNNSAINKNFLTQNYSKSSDIRNIYFPKLGGRLQGILDMNGRNIIDIPDNAYTNSSTVVNRKHIE